MNSGENRVYRVEIPVQIDIELVVKRLPPRASSQRVEGIIRELGDEAREIARPRAVYQLSRARVIDNKTVEIEGSFWIIGICFFIIIMQLSISTDTCFRFKKILDFILSCSIYIYDYKNHKK